MAELTTQALDHSALLSHEPWVKRRPITVSDYYRMAEAGILSEQDRVELIEGEIIEMAPIGSEHHGTVNATTRLLVMAVGGRGVVSVQGPVRLDEHNEPEPDFAVLKPKGDSYRSAHAGPADILLVIEVAKTSLDYDRNLKTRLYGRAGIPEYWLINLVAGEIAVYRLPGPSGYRQTDIVRHGAMLQVQALPGVSLPASEILG